MAPFPIPAHQTRRANFPHRAFRPAASSDPRSRFRDCFTRRQSSRGNLRIHRGLPGFRQCPPQQLLRQRAGNQDPSCSTVITQLSDALLALSDSQCRPPSLPMSLVPCSTDTGTSSLYTRSAFPTCRAPVPRSTMNRCPVSVASRLMLPSPCKRRGRRPQVRFRGLLKLHSRYVLQGSSPTLRWT